MKLIPLKSYINPKNSIVALGLFLSLTVNNLHVQAMQTEEENLYTRVMKVVFDPADKINIKYLRTLNKNDPIHYQKLFAPSENAGDMMSAIALVILAGDETRLRNFLKTKSSANFNYSLEKKQEFAGMRCKEESKKEEFINKHLRTSKVLNPNDPSLYVKYDIKVTNNDFEIYEVNGPLHQITSIYNKMCDPQHAEQNIKRDGITFYSLAHLAIEPYIVCQNWEHKFPQFLPDSAHVTQESRLRVVDMLAEAGADFSCLPNDYRRCFLDAPDVDGILCYQKTPFDAAYPRRLSLPNAQLRHDLLARAVLYGGNLKTKLCFINYIDQLIKKSQEDLLMDAFNQVWEGKVQIDKIRPTEYVKEALEKIKNDKIQSTHSQIIDVNKKKVVDDLDLDINDGVKDMMCIFDNFFRTKEEKDDLLNELSGELDRLQQLQFIS